MSVSVTVVTQVPMTPEDRRTVLQEVNAGKYSISEEYRKELMDLSREAFQYDKEKPVLHISNGGWAALVRDSGLENFLPLDEGCGFYEGPWDEFREALKAGAARLKQKALKDQQFSESQTKTTGAKGATFVFFTPSLNQRLKDLRALWRASRLAERTHGELSWG